MDDLGSEDVAWSGSGSGEGELILFTGAVSTIPIDIEKMNTSRWKACQPVGTLRCIDDDEPQTPSEGKALRENNNVVWW